MIFKSILHVFSVALILLLIGCATPTEKAQRLYDAGKYELILEKYPNEPIAKQARLALADKYVQEGRYEEVLQKFPDITSASAAAKAHLATKLLEEKKYYEILEKYPDSPASMQAREHVAQELYDAGKLDEVADKYPNTAAGRIARNNMARNAFDLAMTKKGDARKSALEAILTDKRYAGTDVYPTVQEQYAKLSGAK